MEMKVVLIRHGYSQGNAENLLSGWSDVPLTPQGIEELNVFKTRYEYPETELYFSSDLERAWHTAKILYPDKKIEKTKIMREINFGQYENKSIDDLDFKQFFDRWLNNEKMADCERYEDFESRIMCGLDSLLKRAGEQGKKSLTIVAHGGVIKTLYISLLKKKRDTFYQIKTKNGLGYIFDICCKASPIEVVDIKEIEKSAGS